MRNGNNPTLKLSAIGALTFNNVAVERLGLQLEMPVALLYDEDNDTWYVAKDMDNGIPLRKIGKPDKGLYFSCSALVHKLDPDRKKRYVLLETARNHGPYIMWQLNEIN